MSDLGLDDARLASDDIGVELLRLNLALAVPMWIERYQRQQPTIEWLIAHSRDVWGDKAALQHEALLYRTKPSKKNGTELPGTSQVFNWFADAVACAALVAEGGIKVFGLRFDAELEPPGVSS